MELRKIMTSEPITVSKEDTVRKALGIMLEFDIRHLPVVEGDKLVGILSDRDIRDYSLPLTEEFFDMASHRAKLDESVSSVMTTGVFTVSVETDMREIIEYMLAEKFTAIPVVSGHDTTLVGIVSYIDILKGYLEELPD